MQQLRFGYSFENTIMMEILFKKKKRKSKEEVKKELKNLFIKEDKQEKEDCNKKAHKVEKCEEKLTIIREYTEIIQTKKITICIANQQGIVFKKFKRKDKLVTLI